VGLGLRLIIKKLMLHAGRSCVYKRNDDDQIWHGYQTRCEEKFYRGGHMLTRDLSAV